MSHYKTQRAALKAQERVKRKLLALTDAKALREIEQREANERLERKRMRSISEAIEAFYAS